MMQTSISASDPQQTICASNLKDVGRPLAAPPGK
jgi:hypothetical protein